MPELHVEEGGAGAPVAKGPNKLMGIGLIVGAMVLGLAVGGMVLGPRFAGGGEAVESADSHGEASGDHGGGGAHARKAASGGHGSAIEIDNIVVNPAGSQGVHFLMATVVIELDDKKAEEVLRSNEHVVKDMILTTLGAQTLEQLGVPGARERLKNVIAEEVAGFLGGNPHMNIYLPQFVVQ
jgi:flagellar basal body-associated protein FliL